MMRSLTMISLVLVATSASATAAASAERREDARARATPSQARTIVDGFDDSLKTLHLEGTDRFDRISDDKDHKDRVLGRSMWHRARSPGRPSRERKGARGGTHHPHVPSPMIPGDQPTYAIPRDHSAPSQPVPEPISTILLASGALVVGYSVRRKLGSSD